MKPLIKLIAISLILFLGGCAMYNKNEQATKGLSLYTDVEVDHIQTELVAAKNTKSEILDLYSVLFLGNKNADAVAIMGESKLLLCHFNPDGSMLFVRDYKYSPDSTKFDVVLPGDSINSVMALDAEGYYPFLYTGRDDFPRISNHFTLDGYLITITYNRENAVLSIEKTPFIAS